jgi:hypothetical protein
LDDSYDLINESNENSVVWNACGPFYSFIYLLLSFSLNIHSFLYFVVPVRLLHSREKNRRLYFTYIDSLSSGLSQIISNIIFSFVVYLFHSSTSSFCIRIRIIIVIIVMQLYMLDQYVYLVEETLVL